MNRYGVPGIPDEPLLEWLDEVDLRDIYWGLSAENLAQRQGRCSKSGYLMSRSSAKDRMSLSSLNSGAHGARMEL